jgi:hypothetical protein
MLQLFGALKNIFVGVALVLFSSASWAVNPPPGVTAMQSVEGVTEYRLESNGLRILLAPDDSKPSTTVNMTYLVGSRHENYGETGMAHLLEHMLFKGTPNMPNALGEFSKRGLASKRHNLGGPNQLLRKLLVEPTNTRLVFVLAGRCNGQRKHQARRPRYRNDRCT